MTLSMILLLAASAGAQNTPDMLRQAAEKSEGALVLVRCQVEEQMGKRMMAGLGVCIESSGVFLSLALDPRMDPDTISQLDIIVPGQDPQTVDAELVGIDPITGLSFIRTRETGNYPKLAFQTSSNLSLGDLVISAGLELGDPALPIALGMGYISAKQEVPNTMYSVTGGRLSTVGSVVFDSQGRVIGLITGQPFERYQTTGQRGVTTLPLRNEERATSFTPVEEFVYILSEIPSDGGVRRVPWIGVGNFSPVSEIQAEAMGVDVPAVMIDKIIHGYAADKAGLKPMDFIIGMNGKPLEDFATPDLVVQNFTRQLLRNNAGQNITLTVLSDGQKRDVQLELEAMPKLPGEALRYFHQNLGMLLRETVMLDQFVSENIPSDAEGLICEAVAQGGPAAQADLQRGDLVTEINGQPVTEVSQVKEIIGNLLSQSPPSDIVLTVRRGEASKNIVIRTRR
jgi:serine protease Do